MVCVIVDYNSGNLRSAQKSFETMARETHYGDIIVSGDPDAVVNAERIVLPGVGAFADCRNALGKIDGLFGAIEEKVKAGTPFMGICVGMQMMADRGLEHGVHDGFGWVSGEVTALEPKDKSLKIPHMGWNSLNILKKHPVLAGINSGDHVYFVHSYHLQAKNLNHIFATADYSQNITAFVARDTMIGTQFHPEKSQKTGLKLIGNFLKWRP